MHFGYCVFVFAVVISSAYTVESNTDWCDPVSEFKCDDGEDCIERKRWCDKSQDCGDDSDEKYCRQINQWFGGKNPNKCPDATHFLCNNGWCIPLSAKCDGVTDCPNDGNDELDCDYSDEEENDVGDDSGQTVDIISTTTVTTDAEDYNAIERPKDSRNFLSSFRDEDDDENDNIDGTYASYDQNVERGLNWLLSTKDSKSGWGPNTARALITLGLVKSEFFKRKNPEVDLMTKQLQIAITVAMLRNESNPVSLTRHALYINALLATCQDPFNLFEMDLVKSLRDRVTREQNRNLIPFVYLTLCLNNQSTLADHSQLTNLLHERTNTPWSSDIKSISLIALACIAKSGKSRGIDISSLRSRYLNKDSTFSNIYSTALHVQAQLALDVPPAESTLKYLAKHQKSNGSFGDLLATYYILPSLARKSLLELRLCSKSTTDPTDGLIPLENLLESKEQRQYVHYSLLYGNPIEVSYSILLQVPVGTKFFDVMRLAAHADSKFKFLYEERSDGNFVYSIGGTPNDAEKGVYWQLYADLSRHSRHHTHIMERNNPEGNLRPYRNSVNNLIAKNQEHVAFWYRT